MNKEIQAMGYSCAKKSEQKIGDYVLQNRCCETLRKRNKVMSLKDLIAIKTKVSVQQRCENLTIKHKSDKHIMGVNI